MLYQRSEPGNSSDLNNWLYAVTLVQLDSPTLSATMLMHRRE
jgi:hypothetical protein